MTRGPQQRRKAHAKLSNYKLTFIKVSNNDACNLAWKSVSVKIIWAGRLK